LKKREGNVNVNEAEEGEEIHAGPQAKLSIFQEKAKAEDRTFFSTLPSVLNVLTTYFS